MEYGTYPKSYHIACRYLVSFGAHGATSNAGRKYVANALRDLRRDFGSEFARKERNHLLFISGEFPVKRGA